MEAGDLARSQLQGGCVTLAMADWRTSEGVLVVMTKNNHVDAAQLT